VHGSKALADADAGFGMFDGAPDSPVRDHSAGATSAAGVDGVPLDAFPPEVVMTPGKGPTAAPSPKMPCH
jgi:hypothetical protein